MKYFKYSRLLLLGLLVIFFAAPFVLVTQVHAQPNAPNGTGPNAAYGNGPNAQYGCGGGNGTFTLCDPLGVKNFCDLVKALLNIVLAIGVPVAVLFLVWAGFRFILARGSQTGLEEAKRNFYYVIIGIAIFLGAWTLATIISATIQTLDNSGTVQFCGK